jgi:hypothetical protein
MNRALRTGIGKQIVDLYLFGNFHIAFCAVALTLCTQSFFGLQLRSELHVFVFCGTFFGYNLQRLPAAFEKSGIQRQFERHHWNTQHRILLSILSGIAAVAFAWSYSRLNFRSQMVALIPAALSFAYAFPVIPARGKWIKLREIPGLKIFIISITWAISCALLPAAAAHTEGKTWFSTPVLLWALDCAILIFSLTIPFDIRDFHYDAEKLKAVPALIGVNRSIGLAIGVLIASAILPWTFAPQFGIETGLKPLAYSAWSVLASVFIYKSSPTRHEYYFSFVIDGLILVLGIMIVYCDRLSRLLN